MTHICITNGTSFIDSWGDPRNTLRSRELNQWLPICSHRTSKSRPLTQTYSRQNKFRPGVGVINSIMMLVKIRTSAKQEPWIWSRDEPELCNPWPSALPAGVVTPLWRVTPLWPHLGINSYSQCCPFRYLHNFSELSNHWLPILCYIQIWQTSLQLSCGNTW